MATHGAGRAPGESEAVVDLTRTKSVEQSIQETDEPEHKLKI